MGGGLIVAEGEQVRASLPLSIGGLMSDAALPEVVAALDESLSRLRLLVAPRTTLSWP